MRTFLWTALLLLASSAFGQGGESVDWCVCVADYGCAEANTCFNAYNCSSTTFNVPSTGSYVVTAGATCSAGSCKECRACVRVSHSQGSFPWCDLGDDCDVACVPNCNNLLLYSTVTYTLTVCLIPCMDGGSDCSDCGQNCRAVGCVMNSANVKCENP